MSHDRCNECYASPDDIEELVLAKIPTLNAQELERVCELIDLDVPTELKRKKREGRKLLSTS